MQCNIDARGKAVRLILGAAMVVGGIVLLTLNALAFIDFGFWLGVALVAFGGFGVFEGASGWCVVRAMGWRTPL